MASEGALIEKAESIYKFNARRGNEVKRDSVVDIRTVNGGKDFRGFRYFDAYDTPQIDSMIWLVNDLCDRFKIWRQTPQHHAEYLPVWKRFNGIASHTHLRRDKSDITPGAHWDRLVSECKLQLV